MVKNRSCSLPVDKKRYDDNYDSIFRKNKELYCPHCHADPTVHSARKTFLLMMGCCECLRNIHGRKRDNSVTGSIFKYLEDKYGEENLFELINTPGDGEEYSEYYQQYRIKNNC